MLVRLFNLGLEIMEVSDDGTGIPAASRQLVAASHATSKLQSMDTLQVQQQQTLGFRGEALFCLANLSRQLIIATRCAEEPLAERISIERDRNNRLGRQRGSFSPRKVGTTVAVIGLLDALPVRRRNLERTVNNQRRQLVRLLQSYAVFSVGIQVCLRDIVTSNGAVHSETTILSSSSKSTTLRESTASVLGSVVTQTLGDFVLELEGGGRVEGLVSRADKLPLPPNSGGQFVAMHHRPVQLPVLTRALNKAWKELVPPNTKRPSLVLKFYLPASAYDVNVAPDKRTVLLTHEARVVDAVREGLVDWWRSQLVGNFRIGRASMEKPVAALNTRQESDQDIDIDDEEAMEEGDGDAASRFNRRYAFSHDLKRARMQHEFDDGRLPSPVRRKLESDEDDTNDGADSKKMAVSLFAKDKEKCIRIPDPDSDVHPVTPSPSSQLQPRNTKPAATSTSWVQGSSNTSFDLSAKHQTDTNEAALPVSEALARKSLPESERRRWQETMKRFNHGESSNTNECQKGPQGLERFGFKSSSANSTSRRVSSLTTSQSCDKEEGIEADYNHEDVPPHPKAPRCRMAINVGQSEPQQTAEDTKVLPASEDEEDAATTSEEKIERKEGSPHVVWNSFEGTAAVLVAAREYRLASRRRTSGSREEGKSEQKSDDENGNLRLFKDDFNSMEIIGQFNMGFILARSKKDDNLWILDQHACDEKYNFEHLVSETRIQEQRLIQPMALELSVSEESCIIDHMDVFEANGFRFKHYPDRPPRHRLALTSLPHSGAQDGQKAVQFGKEDVSALCTIISGTDDDEVAVGGGTGADGSGMYGNNAVRRYVQSGSSSSDRLIARLPKAIAMFASRACRGSIMIGKGLSRTEMDRIVQRLAGLEHPWNCPHGRPTMQHVADLRETLIRDAREAAEYRAGPTLSVLSQED